MNELLEQLKLTNAMLKKILRQQSELYELTVEEASVEMGVDVRNLIRKQLIKGIPNGNEFRIPRWVVKEWQRSQLQLKQTNVQIQAEKIMHRANNLKLVSSK